MAKSKYETHVLPNLEKITDWAKQGATSKDIAAKLSISYSTFRSYIAMGEDGDARYTALSEAFARACEIPDDAVEAALYKSCLGYNAEIIKHYKIKTVEYNEETGKRIRETEELVEARDEVHVPANTSAQMFWLTNRRPDRWSYKPDAGADEEGEESGIVMLAPVMENPGPPVRAGDGEDG
ncbi:MAG: hypothetical protein RR365_13115 [Bacteroides sp.]